MLGNQFLRANDWTRHRAMLESSLEAFFLPRHRSVVAAELCLGACRKGDVAGAETWLALLTLLAIVFGIFWVKSH